MWSFRLGRGKKDQGPSQRDEAQQAKLRAEADIEAVLRRRPEVDWLYGELLDRKHKNNFGPSLAMAIERRSAGID